MGRFRPGMGMLGTSILVGTGMELLRRYRLNRAQWRAIDNRSSSASNTIVEIPLDGMAAHNGVSGWSALPPNVQEAILQTLEEADGNACLANVRLVSRDFRDMVDGRGLRLSASRLFAYGGTLESLARFRCVSSLNIDISNLSENSVVEALSNVRGLCEVSFKGMTGSTAICDLLQGQSFITKLEFIRTSLPHLRFLGSLQNLTNFCLRKSTFEDSDLEFLGSMVNLRELTMDDCRTQSTAYLGYLSSIPNLNNLNLGLRDYTRNHLLSLVFLKADLALTIYSMRCRQKLSAIKFLSSLRGLRLSNCGLRHLGFSLKRLPFLRKLDLNVGTLCAPDVVNLMGVKNQLQSVDLKLGSTNMIIVNALLRSQIPIRSLTVNTTFFCPNSNLEDRPQLERLRISATKEVDPEVFSLLSLCPALQDVTLGEALFSVDGLADLAVACPLLRRLAIGSCLMGPDHMMHLARVEKLETLELRGCIISNISTFNHMPSLKHLVFASCLHFGDHLDALFEEAFVSRLRSLTIMLVEDIPFENKYGERVSRLTQDNPSLKVHVEGPGFELHF